MYTAAGHVLTINGANKTLDVCVFTITCNEIADAVIGAKKRGEAAAIRQQTALARPRSRRTPARPTPLSPPSPLYRPKSFNLGFEFCTLRECVVLAFSAASVADVVSGTGSTSRRAMATC